MRRPSSAPALFATAVLLLAGRAALAQCNQPARDFGGADWTVPGNASLCAGNFTNIGTLTISAGTTVFVDQTTVGPVNFFATTVRIAGNLTTINGGRVGGNAPGCSFGGNGNAGDNGQLVGNGGGGGSLAVRNPPNGTKASGGGGGGNGGAGGGGGIGNTNGVPGTGGSALGNATDINSVLLGSGGGSAGCGGSTGFQVEVAGDGGTGGGAVRIFAKDLEVSGVINANGSVGADGGGNTGFAGGGAGGGGAGGTVVLSASERLSVTGTVAANGGNGGRGMQGGGGGGGGGGGRIKLYQPFPTCTGVTGTVVAAGGKAGTGFSAAVPATDGGAGSVICQNIEVAPAFASIVANPTTLNEGDTAIITAVATDANVPWPGATSSQLVKYAFDCDGDGTFEIGPQVSGTASCKFLDNGNPNRTVTVRASDWNSIDFKGTSPLVAAGTLGYNGVATTTISVRVDNVAPTIATMNVPTTATEGPPAVSMSATAKDPSPIDEAILTYSWDFGDGTAKGAGSSVSHTYADNGSYTVTLTVTDKEGAFATKSMPITITSVPPTISSIAVPTLSEGVSGTFGSTVSDPSPADQAAGFDYDWDFGDGTAHAIGHGVSAPAHVYVESGTYTLTLKVTDKDGASASKPATVTVANLPPTVSITSALTPIDEGGSTTVVASASDTAGDVAAGFTYAFKWGDGTADTVGTSATASHSYVDNGSYTVSVTATDRDGGKSATPATTTIVVRNVTPTITTLTGPAAAIDEGATASFTGAATDPGTADTLTYAWDFGDGGTQSGVNLTAPTHKYVDNGTFTVSLRVTDKDGAAPAAKTISVVVNNVVPTVAITPPAGAPFEGASAQFASTVTDPGTADTAAGFTYTWAWGDGTANTTGKTQDKPSHVFAESGTYHVVLTVTDKDGGAGTAAVDVTVNNAPPTVTIQSTTPNNPTEGSTVTVNAKASDTNGDQNAGFTWTFKWGDGSPDTVQTTASATHRYVDNGSFAVQVQAKDRDGGVGTSPASTVVVTNVNPVVTFAAPAGNGSEGSPVTFSPTATDAGDLDRAAGYTWAWDFGDGTTGTGAPPQQHVFADNGKFRVTVTATDKDGGKDTKFIDYTVDDVAPVVTLGAFPDPVTAESPATFTATAVDPSTTDTLAGFVYVFDWGDNSSSTVTATEASLQHTYQLAGNYTVKVTAKDKDGKVSNVDSRVLRVLEAQKPPKLTLSPATQQVAEGTSATIVATFSDPNTGDKVASIAWQFGDATSATLTNPASPLNQAHTFADSGTYIVTATASDSTGLSTTQQVQVVVANVPPTAVIDSVGAATEGVAVPVTGHATDTSSADDAAGYSFRWNWGDGSADSVGQGLSSTTHTYADSGIYTISLEATDKDGGKSALATKTVQVGNADPGVTLTGPATGNEGDTLNFAAAVTDVAADASAGFTYDWNWGDGSPDAIGKGLSPQSHQFRDDGAAAFDVSVTVTDKDGGQTKKTMKVKIGGLKPVLVLGPFPSPVTKGTAATFTATATDAGPADQAAGFTFTFDFGDGTAPVTSRTGSATHTYAATGPFVVTVRATDKDGLASDPVSRTVNVTAPQVNNPPTITVAPANATIAEGGKQTFTATFSDPDAGDKIVSIVWKFGDGQTLTSTNPTSPLQVTHTYADNGSFSVTATATDAQGAAGTGVATVTATSVPPTATLGAVPTGLTEGGSAAFSATATDPSPADTTAGFTYTWKWGDGSPDTTGAAPSHAFVDNGTFTVTLVVTDKDGAASTPVTATVQVAGAAPAVTLTVPATGNEGEAIAFSAAVTDPSSADTTAGFAYAWDFGDGSAPVTGSNLASASHTYADDGTYTVTLKVADKDGLSTTKTAALQVKNAAPVATLGAFPSPVSKGIPASFSASATDPGSVDTTAGFLFTFDWGDGNTSTANGATATVSHTYANAGSFSVKVTAKDKDGGVSAVVSRLVNVVPASANRAPTVALAPPSQSVAEAGTASLTATFSDPDTGDKVATLAWDFGDGKTQTTTSPASPLVITHSYVDSGTYTIQVTATDTKGGTSSALATVTATNAAPVVALGPVPPGLTTGVAATFTASATDASTADQAAGFTFTFTWGDGKTSTATGTNASVQHAFAASGTYTVTVVAVDKDGATSAPASKTVSVGLGNVAPDLALTPPTQAIKEGGTAFLTATFSDPNAGDQVATLSWDFGDGKKLDVTGPVSPLAQSHAYDNDGTYTVTLVATDGTGLTTTQTVQVTVSGAPPVVALDALPAGTNEGANATFTATVADPSAADTAAGLQYAWDFGDGSAPVTGKDLASVTHAYADDGTYTVKLTVTDRDGLSGTSSGELRVANVPPAVVLAGASTVDLGEAWTATATATDVSSVDQSAGFTFAWSFGDGTPDETGPDLSAISHGYVNPGTYTVTVVVTDADGGATTQTQLVVVGDVAPVLEAGADTDAVRHVPVVFAPVATWAGGADKLTWAWDFGDGATSTDAAPTHAYERLGTFTVTVTVTDPSGLTATDALVVTVKNVAPTATAVTITPATPGTDDALTVGYTFADADGDTEGATTFAWYVDGKVVDALVGKKSILPEQTVRGQVWEVEVTPNDGQESGLAVKSAPVTIGNQRPEAADVAILPAAPTSADTLVASWRFTDADRDAEDGSEIHWTKNGQAVPELDGHRTVAGPLKKGDVWRLTIVPNDGADRGEPVQGAEVTIGNAAPVFTKLDDVLIPAVNAGPVLDVKATDPDGDAVTITCTEGGSPVDLTAQFAFAEAGSYRVDCIASDGTANTAGHFTAVVGDALPVVDAGPDRTVDPGRPALTAVAKDPQGRPVTFLWSLKSSPEPTVLLTPNAATTSFFARKAGAYVLRVTASNGAHEASDEVTVTVRNLAPYADPGASPLFAKVGEALALDGSKSADPNADALTYAWTRVSGPEATLDGADTATPKLTEGGPGEIVLKLTVSDGTLSASADVTVRVAAEPGVVHPPIAHAGADATLLTHEVLVLDGSASWDPDGDVLSYAWSLVDGPGATLTNATDAKANFQPDAPGTYTFELAVNDGSFTSRDRVVVVVTEGRGTRPEAKIDPAEQTVGIDTVVALDGSGSTGLADASLTYRWTQVAGPQVAIAGADQPKASFVTTVAGDVVVELVVTDPNADSRPARAVVHVTESDAARPVANAGADERGFRDELFTLDGSLSNDPSGGALVFAWGQVGGPAVVLDGADSAHPTFTPNEPGEYVFQLVVASGPRTSAPDTVTITVTGDPTIAGGCGCGPGATLSAMPLLGLLAMLKRRRKVA